MSARCLATVILSICLCGCATIEPTVVGAPPDFSLELTTWNGSEATEGYIVFPDGGLYIHDGDAPELSPRRRTLSRPALADLWSLATELGFTPASTPLPDGAGAAEVAGQPPGGPIDPPAPGQVTTRVTVTADGRRVQFQDAGPVDAPDPRMATLTDVLAALSWREELRATEITVVPKRYDLGPDPYARYR